VSSRWFRNSFVYLLILVAVAALFFSIFQAPSETPMMTLGELADAARAGRVEEIRVSGDELTVTLKDGEDQEYKSRKELNVGILEALRDLGVSEAQRGAIQIEVEEPSQWGNWLGLLAGFLPLLFVGALFIFLMRQAQSGSNQALSFGRSKARLFTGDKPKVTFDDVAGVEEAKSELYEVVEFLQEPEKFTSLGARIPKGVLLVGAPGTGKTLLSRAVAGEASVPFFSISGSEFVEMFVGVGASRVRDLFDQAKRNAPCIVFVDEIDAVGRQRGAGLGGSHDEREQTLNQILVEMDGFDTDTNVIVIAATNRPDILDPALLRPGRFDRRVVLDRPDMKGREAIMDVHVRGKPLDEDVEVEKLARQTPGFAGADIENLVNEAAILAARSGRKTIMMQDFEEAIQRVSLGPERKSRLMSDEEKRITAYHEAGHALVMRMVPHGDPVYKLSIIPRGMAGGYTMPLPEEDRVYLRRSYLESQLSWLLGGHAAEAIVFEDLTTGSSNDLERATQMARKMITQYGMSESLGPQTFGQKEELIFLGREISEQRDYGEETACKIDSEVRNMIEKAYTLAKEIITKHRDKLDAIAQNLIEKETLDGEEFEAIFA